MVVRLRLARHGTKNNPFYHVVAIRDKASREARPIEKLGEYDPIPRPKKHIATSSSSFHPSTSAFARVTSSGLEDHKVVLEKRIEWDASRIQYWLGIGAQPSKPVARLLDRAGLIPEGKTYKGIYRPPGEDAPAKAPSASPVAILQAAGAAKEGGKKQVASSGQAATALRQGETVNTPKPTRPLEEASKTGAGEGTIDQAQ